MLLSDFDFDLPSELIAQIPAENRDHSRLMVVRRDSGEIHHHPFPAILDLLSNRPLMVFNDTQVIPAKLVGQRQGSEKSVEFLLVREIEPGVWEGLIQGLAKLKPGQEFEFCGRKAIFKTKHDDLAVMEFPDTGNFRDWLQENGRIPLPPYIKRTSESMDTHDALDRERYQTVFSKHPGAIAAPTAGLHFTPEILTELEAHADTAYLTLHVGPGTFLPVRVDRVEEHAMRSEQYFLPSNTWDQIIRAKQEKRSVLAVGTTTTRVLESLIIEGEKPEGVSGWTDCFIYPGHRFRNVDHLLTNFHLPKSTLYMLVCAFAGEELMKKAYKTAIAERYRFFSYGDAMLII